MDLEPWLHQYTIELLERADELLTEAGWCQGAFYIDKAHCTVGALKAATNTRLPVSVSLDCEQRAINTIAKVIGDGIEGCDCAMCRAQENFRTRNRIIAWNDKPERTVEDVHLTIKQAIVELQAQEY